MLVFLSVRHHSRLSPLRHARSLSVVGIPKGFMGGLGGESADVKFELTNKGIDFLGYRTLRDLLASLGRSSVGRHDTRELSTGVEASEAPKRYEFGDTLNLDIPGTLLRAIQREA